MNRDQIRLLGWVALAVVAGHVLLFTIFLAAKLAVS